MSVWFSILAWKAVNIGLRKVGGIWLWSNKLSTELAYTDQWKGADPTGDGECVNMYEWRGYYGFNDHHCRDPISYLCEDVSCYWSAESQNRNVPGRYWLCIGITINALFGLQFATRWNGRVLLLQILISVVLDELIILPIFRMCFVYDSKNKSTILINDGFTLAQHS